MLTLESHVFEEVSGAVGTVSLCAATGINPAADGSGLSRGVGLGCDSQTIAQGGGLSDGLCGVKG